VEAVGASESIKTKNMKMVTLANSSIDEVEAYLGRV